MTGAPPDVDLRALAEALWAKGQQDSALAVLNYLIDTDPERAAGARIRLAQYRQQILQDQSPTGKLRGFAWGFLSGKANSMAELSGSVASNFVLYGDVRDVLVESLSATPDPFILFLSSVGIVTTFWPPADSVVNLLKAGRRLDVITPGMVRQATDLLTETKALGAAADGAPSGKALENILELGQRTSFPQFCHLMRQTDNVGFLGRMAHLITKLKAGAARQLEALAIILAPAPDLFRRAVAQIDAEGQAAMDLFYRFARKGPRGIRFLLEHPRLLSSSGKGTVLSTRLGLATVNDWYRTQLVRVGRGLELVRYLGIALLLLGTLHLLFPGQAAGWMPAHPAPTADPATPAPTSAPNGSGSWKGN